MARPAGNCALCTVASAGYPGSGRIISASAQGGARAPRAIPVLQGRVHLGRRHRSRSHKLRSKAQGRPDGRGAADLGLRRLEHPAGDGRSLGLRAQAGLRLRRPDPRRAEQAGHVRGVPGQRRAAPVEHARRLSPRSPRSTPSTTRGSASSRSTPSSTASSRSAGQTTASRPRRAATTAASARTRCSAGPSSRRTSRTA